MDWKNRSKRTLRAKLIIVSLILALVGWFLLGVLLVGRFYEPELLEIERPVESSAFVWRFRGVIIAFSIFLVWKHEWLALAWQKQGFRYSFYVIFGIGVVGWVMGIIDLIV